MTHGRISATGVLLAAHILSMQGSTLAAQPPRPPLDIVEVQAVAGTISISTLVRIVVRNTTATAQQICIGAYHLAVRPGGDAYAEGNARDCREHGPFVSLPPGGAHVVQRSILRRAADADATIQIGMLIFHRGCAGGSIEMADLAWEGSMREAEAAGRATTRRQ